MEHDDESDDSGSGARRVRRGDGRPDETNGDAQDVAVRPGADVAPDADGDPIEADVDADDEAGPGFELAVRRSTSHKGPLPSPSTLADYDAIVPGAARQIVDSHIRSNSVAADAIERLSTAEARAVTVGAVGAQVLTIGGLLAAVGLIFLGYPTGAIAAVIPAVLGAAAQVASAVRRGQGN